MNRDTFESVPILFVQNVMFLHGRIFSTFLISAVLRFSDTVRRVAHRLS